MPAAVWLLILAPCLQAAPPRVVKAAPDNGARDVDPALKQLRIEFDQDMRPDGFSVCGGRGLEITGKPRWQNKRTFILPVKLKPGQKVELSVNCPGAQNFRSAGGESAEIYPIAFAVRKAGAKPAPPLSADEKRTAIERLRAAIDERYSYRDRLGIDWEARFAEFAPKLDAATAWSEFVRSAAELLTAAQDPHIWFTLDGQTIGTYQRQVAPNFNARSLPKLVPGWKLHNRAVATGRFEDGIGYVLIATWSIQDEADLRPALDALEQFAAAPGIVLDVRANGGGNELLARRIAGCFIDKPTPYARNRNRDASLPDGFTKVFDRVVEPCSPAIKAPVAVLMGPKNMSSCESFLMMMAEAPRATLVGAPTYGSSGNPQPYELADGLAVFLPSWQDMQLDGTLHEGHPLRPDVNVQAEPADFTAGDPVLSRALEVLRSAK
jgi:hypothetical protein